MSERSILVADIEGHTLTVLRRDLEQEGFSVLEARDGEQALQLTRTERPHMVLLDCMLPPPLSGFEVCLRLRGDPVTRRLPIMLLSALGAESERLRGFDSGADDFVTKPFSSAELIARIRAVLRRSRSTSVDETLQYAGIKMDLVAHRVRRNGRDLHLAPTEYRLLRFFLENPGRVFSREQLLDRIWSQDISVELRTVDVHIRRLRKAINGPREPDLIRTVRSAGYGFDGSR